MVNAYIRAKSPKGNVGVTDVVDAGELSAYSSGVISGYTASGASSWTLSIGGVTGTQDVAVAKNPGGESELLVGTAGQDIDFIIGGAPGTPGQSRTDALVIYKDPFTTSVVNNGIDVVDYQVVAGTPATTGTQVPPNDATIRATIPTGSLKFVVVVGYVTIANGAGSVTVGNYSRNLSEITSVLYHGNIVADSTARTALTAYEGMSVHQLDDDARYVYTSGAWIAYDNKWQTWSPTLTNLSGGTQTKAIYYRSGKKVMFRFHYTLGGAGVSGGIRFSLPFTSAAVGSGEPLLAQVNLYDISGTYVLGNAIFDSTTAVRIHVQNVAGTYTQGAYETSATLPFTWASGDHIYCSGEYEIA